MDLRIERIFIEHIKNDKSFREKENPFFKSKYSQIDLRETWERGIKHGIEIGLMSSSLEGQKIELYENTNGTKNKEFLDKLYLLCEEYNSRIQYHPEYGMTVVKLDNYK